jgi:hypothetical protein
MSLLAPWFLLGAALIAGPIVAHLIRRATRERLTFSALRFLDTSPPRLDRRSRVQNPWLLALRCLIVAVLAFGFARPFLRQDTPTIGAPAVVRHVVAVLDESASMRRAGLWDAAKEKINALTDTLRPGDQFVLLAAGERVTELIGAAQWLATPVSDRPALVSAILDAREPGWGPTPLDSAGEAALARWEDMAEVAANPSARHELVFVSDFAAGSRVSGLANVDWPSNASVVLEQVEPAVLGNASLHWLGWANPGEPNIAARIRVTRSFDAPEALRLRWHDAKTNTPLGPADSLMLLPGASEVRLMPLPENSPPALRLDLEGEAQDYDNRLWLVRAAPRELGIHYLGAHAAHDSRHSRFYIERAAAGWREPVARFQTGLPTGDDAASASSLLIITEPPDPAQLAQVRSRLEGGAFALVLLKDESLVATAAALAGESGWTAKTPERPDAMFGQLDFQHPLFAPFADPLYSDFTRIRFWQPRSIALPPDSKTTVVARFEDGSPAVLEAPVGRGRLIIWGGDWAPSASQWVLSSKFVPWLQALAERAAGGIGQPAIVELGDVARVVAGSIETQWQRLDATPQTSATSELPAQPGLYKLIQNGGSREVALLVPAVESDTQTLPLDTWEQLGVPLQTDDADATETSAAATSPVSTNSAALESRQQMWRWLLWVAVALLAIESAASFVVSRRRGATA